MGDPITVGLGQYAVSRDPDIVIVAFGLGSCVGVSMYDPQRHIGGLLHAMLPEQTMIDGPADGRYVVSGIPILLDEVIKAGALRSNLILRMAGGAMMLLSPGTPNGFEIGRRNVEAAHATLSKHRLSLTAEETGGNNGRTMRLYIGTGRVTIRAMGAAERDMIDNTTRPAATAAGGEVRPRGFSTAP
jgi:chemotaxis protein CheD